MHIQPAKGAEVLGDPFWLEPPDAPNARLVCATVRPAEVDAGWAGFADADVAGLDLDSGVALARCRGEAIEYLSQLNPVGEPALAADDAVAARDLLSGAECRVTAGEVLRLGVDQADVGAGCAAGQSWDAAVAAGFWELVERDAVAHWWYEAQPGRPLSAAVEEAALAHDAELRGGQTSRRTSLIDISIMAGLPVVVALSARTAGGGLVAGMAGHADPLVAAQKAIRELVQMEVGLRMAEAKRDRGRELNVFEQRMLRREAELDAAAPKLSVDAAPFEHPPAVADVGAQTRAATERLGEAVQVVDLTRPRFGVPVAKLVARGLRRIPDAAAWEAGQTGRVALY